MTDNKEIISVINDLIETSKDGEQGFRDAAEGVQNSGLRMKISGEFAHSAPSSPENSRRK